MRYKALTDEDATKLGAVDTKMWRVRSTLMRIKRPLRVMEMLSTRAKMDEKHRTDNNITRGTRLEEKSPPDLPFDCEDEECETCFPQYFPAVYSVTDEEARDTVNSLVGSINRDLLYLRGMLASHADLIVTRWQNKSRTRRHKLLMSETDIYPRKWAPIHLLHGLKGPDEAWHELTAEKTLSSFGPMTPQMSRHLSNHLYQAFTEHSKTQFQTTWFLPYMDAETLAEDPLRLLGLLYHRTQHEPNAWLMFDNSQLVLAEHLGVTLPEFHPSCVVMQGHDFGKLVPWNAHQAHRWEIVGYNKAQYLLTAQQKMMGFLRKVVEKICQEATHLHQSSTNPKWEAHVGNNFSSPASRQSLSWTTDSVRPFSAPPSFDPHKVLEMVTARYRAVKDDLELVQTDPSYVQFLVSELASTVFMEKTDREHRWAYYVDELMLVPLRRELYWRQLLVECEALVAAFEAARKGPVSPDDEGYDIMLEVIVDMTTEFFAVMASMLDYSLPFQRGLERNFEYRDGLGINGKREIKLQVIEKDSFPDDLLFWSLNCLGADQYRQFSMDPAWGFRCMDDYLANANAKDKARINQRLYNHVSDMTIINEVLSATKSERLRNRATSYTLVGNCAQAEFRKQFIKKIQTPNMSKLSINLAKRLKDLCQNNAWPAGKRDASWLEKATSSRKSLARYWQMMRVLWSRELSNGGVMQSFVDEDIELLSADQSLKYATEVQMEKEDVERDLAARRRTSSVDGDKLDDHFSAMHISIKKENAVPRAPISKPKTKTRPARDIKPEAQLPVNAAVDPEARPALQESWAVPLAPVLVKQENLALFSDMFPEKGCDGQRAFRWQHFLDAMEDVGFHISQASGSAVTFRLAAFGKAGALSPSGDAGSIVFHRPHPDPVIHPIMLRTMGKRLGKWFGWQREVFVDR